jgi:hypothetical protein
MYAQVPTVAPVLVIWVSSDASDTEVDEVGEVVFGDQDVGRLDVAVHQPDLVCSV